jgi:predicted glycoside hydrolase/deacetylase ChbG (UPF0249 family)
MRHIVVCADDYAIAPGVSKAIRALVERGRINATSAMVVVPGLAEEAKALAATGSPIRIEFGLHVTLSGGFKPLVASPLPTEDGNLPPMSRLLAPFARFQIDRTAIEAEVSAQLQAFSAAFGRPPDFIDGHHHVQLYPGVRDGLLAAVARAAPKAWVRQCAPADWRTLLAADRKSQFIAYLSAGFRRAARRAGLAYNPAFAGAYDYGARLDFAALFPPFIERLPAGGVVMCHPGFVDQALRSRDLLTAPREAEYAYFAGDAYPSALARAGVTLA